MRVSSVAWLLGGSLAVYVAVACAAAKLDDGPGPRNDGGLLGDSWAPGDAKADPPPVSGTRLRARYTVTSADDGAKHRVFSGWYDGERKESCMTTYEAADGQRRCLPTNWIGIGGYADAGCTKPFAIASKAATCTPPKYAAEQTTGTCGLPRVRLYALGAETTVSTYFTKDASGCKAAAAAWPWTGTYTTYNTTSEVPASAFAAVTIAEEIE